MIIDLYKKYMYDKKAEKFSVFMYLRAMHCKNKLWELKRPLFVKTRLIKIKETVKILTIKKYWKMYNLTPLKIIVGFKKMKRLQLPKPLNRVFSYSKLNPFCIHKFTKSLEAFPIIYNENILLGSGTKKKDKFSYRIKKKNIESKSVLANKKKNNASSTSNLAKKKEFNSQRISKTPVLRNEEINNQRISRTLALRNEELNNQRISRTLALKSEEFSNQRISKTFALKNEEFNNQRISKTFTLRIEEFNSQRISNNSALRNETRMTQTRVIERTKTLNPSRKLPTINSPTRNASKLDKITFYSPVSESLGYKSFNYKIWKPISRIFNSGTTATPISRQFSSIKSNSPKNGQNTPLGRFPKSLKSAK